jgi:glutaminyl-tRNA synthetase
VRAEWYPDSRSGTPGADSYKVKGNIHWLSVQHSSPAEIRIYDRLFGDPNPAAAEDFRTLLNPDSIRILRASQVEPALLQAMPGSHWQFERKGYFCADSRDSKPGAPVFNLAVTLKDAWQKR